MQEQIFTTPEYYNAHIYEFQDSPYPSPFYNSSISFTSGKELIGIIDQFQGKRPKILNRDYIVNKKQIDSKIVCTLILDSQTVDHLHKFETAENHKTTDIVRTFLKHVSKKNCDYNPVFFLLENWAKSSNDQYLKKSSEKLSSILKLHSMREDIFIEKGIIEYKKDAIDHYCKLYNSENLDECGAAWAKRLTNHGLFSHQLQVVEILYTCLLKMVLIHFINPEINEKNIMEKNYKFQKFLKNDLNLRLARESALSIYYFAGYAGKLIGTQTRTPYEKAVIKLKATAWDMLLLRFPEFLLSPRNKPEMNLAYVVTAEKKLFEIGKMFSFESLFYRTQESQGELNLNFDYEKISEKISQQSIKILKKQNHESPIITQRLSKEKTSWIKKDLEIQLKNLCS